MKHLFTFLLLITSLSLVAQIEFREFDDWNDALAAAEKENKFIYLDAYTDWCYWCKVQDKELFTQAEVADFLNEHFIPVKMNFEDSLGLVLSRKFRVWAYPTSLYFNPDGELVHKHAGYTSEASKFIETGKNAMRFKEGQRYGFSSRNLEPNFPDFYIKSLVAPDNREKAAQEEVNAYLDNQKDLFSEESWSVMYRFNLTEKYEKYLVDNFDKYKSIFGKEETESLLYQTAYYGVVNAANEKDETTMKKWCDIASEKMETDQPDDIRDNLCMTYFQKTEEYDKYFKIAEKVIDRKGTDNHASVNTMAWNTYLNVDDKSSLQKAASWMAKVVKEKPDYAYLDTYAALLLKSGDKKNGKKWAMKAIEVGEANGQKVDDTKKLLEKFAKKKKKK